MSPISYGTQQVEPHFLMAYLVHSYERAGTDCTAAKSFYVSYRFLSISRALIIIISLRY